MDKVYLGQGVKYPISLINGSADLVKESELIKQSIGIVLKTPQGSRFMLPEYGSRLDELMFEPNDEVLQDLVKFFIYEALAKWETRIKFQKIDFTQENEILYCEITYKILKSNEIDSFIYPFYRQLRY